MEFIQKSRFSMQSDCEHLVIPYFKETDIVERFHCLDLEDFLTEERLKKAIAAGTTEAGRQKYLTVHEDKCLQITFLNLDGASAFDFSKIREQFQKFGRTLQGSCQILLEGLQMPGTMPEAIAEAIVKAVILGGYSFPKGCLKEKSGGRIYSLRDKLKEEKQDITVTLISRQDIQRSIKKASDYGTCINHARMLGDIPNNYLHVEQLAGYARDLASSYRLQCEILGRKELEELQCGGILGVNKGSQDEANLITLYYEGSKGAPVTALVGKGVMFDSGGYHLKQIGEMEGMKYDMCGAANLLSAMEIVIRQKSRKNILLVIPAVENLIGPSACKMGDVLTTLSGKTVEVYNTDAEGRLILCDAISYAIKKGADRIIDLTTLTCSCRMALGDEISGAFSNDDGFYDVFSNIAAEMGEKIWRLPLDDVYRRQIRHSQVADLINYAPGQGGGASIAACFLEAFVGEAIPWIHLDIVGPAVKRTDSELQSAGATGVLAASIAAYFDL